MCTQKISIVHFTLQLIWGHYYHLTFRDRDSSMILTAEWFKVFFFTGKPHISWENLCFFCRFSQPNHWIWGVPMNFASQGSLGATWREVKWQLRAMRPSLRSRRKRPRKNVRSYGCVSRTAMINYDIN